MSITFPIDHPTQKFAAISLRPMSVVGVSKSPFTGASQVQAHQGQWWEAAVDIAPGKASTIKEWIAFLVSLNGREGTFNLKGEDTLYEQRGSAATTPGTPLVNGGAQAGDEITIDGATAGASGYLKAGDYIRLTEDGLPRLHMVLADVDTDSGGNATITIWPDLRDSPADDSAVAVGASGDGQEIYGLFRLKDNIVIDINEALIYGLSFEIEEVL